VPWIVPEGGAGSQRKRELPSGAFAREPSVRAKIAVEKVRFPDAT